MSRNHKLFVELYLNIGYTQNLRPAITYINVTPILEILTDIVMEI